MANERCCWTIRPVIAAPLDRRKATCNRPPPRRIRSCKPLRVPVPSFCKVHRLINPPPQHQSPFHRWRQPARVTPRSLCCVGARHPHPKPPNHACPFVGSRQPAVTRSCPLTPADPGGTDGPTSTPAAVGAGRTSRNRRDSLALCRCPSRSNFMFRLWSLCAILSHRRAPVYGGGGPLSPQFSADSLSRLPHLHGCLPGKSHSFGRYRINRRLVDQ